MANPRKPSHLKAIAGTDQPCRREPSPAVEMPLLDAVPPAPDWMPNAHAIKEWDRIVPILIANKLLTDAALSTLAQMCALHGKIVQLYAAGESPNASMVAQYRGLANDFGLTPVAQGKVRPSGPPEEAPGNRFQKNGRRPG